MSKKKVKQGLSLVMSLLLCVTSANFSMLASAAEPNAARIIGFNQLGESIASQNLPVGASIDDVIFPESIKATVETVEEIEVKKLIEKEKPDEAEDEKAFSTDEDDTDVETVDKAAEPEEKAEETTTDEAIVEEEPTGPEAEQPEEATAEETIESEPEALEDTEKEEAVDSSFIDILFPAMIVHAAEQEEEPSLVSGAMDVSSEPEYETVVEKKIVQSEITISDVKWKIENGAKFDSSKEASFVFRPVFNIDYIVNAETPTIKVNIVNTNSKAAFEKSQVVDGVRVLVKADAGVFPEGATLSVAKVSGQELQAVEEAVDEARADAKNKVESYTFDIKVLDKDGNEIEPDNSNGQVKVSFTLEEVADVNLDTDVYHVKGEVGDLSVDKLEAEEVAATTVEAVTDGFSFYTVEFTYNNLQYVMNGDTTVALSEILSAVGLEGEVSAAVSDAPELFSVSKEDGGWYVTASQAFDTEQKLTVTIEGTEYVIAVTDDSYKLVIKGNTVDASSDCSGDGWVYSAIPKTLTLVNFTYDGTKGTDNEKYFYGVYTTIPDLEIKVNGENLIKGFGLYSSESLKITFSANGTLNIESTGLVSEDSLSIGGVGTLNVTNDYGTAISVENELTITDNVNVSTIGGEYGITANAGPVTLSSDGEIFIKGNAYFGLYSDGEISITNGKVIAEGGAAGIAQSGGSERKPLSIGDEAALVAIGGDCGAIYYFNDSQCRKVKNAISGEAWTGVDRTGDSLNIEISDSGQAISNIYKRVEFPSQTPATKYDLWVGGVQVTEANASNIDGNSKASYDAENNILTLNGYSYEGIGYYDDFNTEAAILYNGDTDLTIDFKGNNTLKLDKSSISSIKYVIYGEKGFIFKSSDNTGTLKLSFDNTTTFKDSCMAIYSRSGAIRFTSGTVYATGGNTAPSTAAHSSGVVSDAVYIDGGTVYATGGDLTVPIWADSNLYSFGIEQAGFSLGTLTISKGKLEAKGGGLVKPEGSSDAYYFASVGVSAKIELGNADFRSVGDTCAIQLLKNSIAGKGGEDLGNLTEVINVSDNLRNLTYKAVDFTAKSVPAPLTKSEAFDAIIVDFENETVSPVIGYEVSSSNESYVPVTSLTELLDSDNPAIYVRIAETDTALASPWTEIVWPRPAAPSGIEGGAEEIIGTTTDMEYTKVGESTYTTASNKTTAVRAGEYLIRLKAGILNFASKPVKVVVYANEPVQETKDPQNPPTADQFTVINAMPGKSDGAISGVTKAMEYSADNGVTWTLIKANPLTGLAAGTYLIRYAETAEKEASDSIAIKVDEKETGSISILVKPENSEEQRSFEIRVEKGNSIVATRNFGKISEAGSTVTFEDLEVGIYNIICLSTNEEFAETKLLTVEKGKVTDIAFTVLPGEIKTLVTVGEDAPAVAVDGLSSLLTPEEKEAAANGDKAITVELTAEKISETATGVEDIKNIMTPGQTIDTVLDLSLFKNTKDLNTGEETKDNIGQNNKSVLEIAIPYDVADGKEISIFRYHEDANGGKTTKQFSSLSSRLVAGLFEDAKFFFDRIKKYIYLYASDFSTYAIAISDSSETASASASSESGSNSSSGIKTVPVYRLFNTTKGYHFYTADAAEKDTLVAAGWNDEGIAWQAGDKNGKPVYRLFDVNGNGGHIFTTSEEEKASYIAKGYRDEGIGWYAPSYAGRKVYKITNKTNGQVLYTISMDEKNALEAAGFICEEAGFVAY